MAEERCDFSELPASSCAHCTGREGDKSDTVFIANGKDMRGTWFEARFAGPCAGCGYRIRAGQMIRSDGNGGWLCTDCGE